MVVRDDRTDAVRERLGIGGEVRDDMSCRSFSHCNPFLPRLCIQAMEVDGGGAVCCSAFGIIIKRPFNPKYYVI